MTLASVTIRAAGQEDARTVIAAYEWLFATPGRRPREWDERIGADRLLRAIVSPSSTVLIALTEERLVGFCTIYLDLDSVRFGRRAWVEDLAVHPDQRSLGIGKGLLDAAKSWARKNGATHLGLESSVTRVDAHRFYEREDPTSRSKSFGWDLAETPPPP